MCTSNRHTRKPALHVECAIPAKTGLCAITVLALDIDGVLTDGTVTWDEFGRESKALCYQDVDAVFMARRQGLRVVLITGEDSAWVKMVATRLQADRVYAGAKDKAQAVRELCQELKVAREEICLVGDSARDAQTFPYVGLAFAPADAARVARAAADRVLGCPGGRGAVAEVVELILQARSHGGHVLRDGTPAREQAQSTLRGAGSRRSGHSERRKLHMAQGRRS